MSPVDPFDGKSYKVIAISVYLDDLKRLDDAVERLKARGVTNASRSGLIRIALEEARKRAGAWQWMGATPIAVQRDPEYAAAVFAEGGELHPPIGSPAYETFIGRKIDATAPPPDAKANTHDVIPAQEVLDRAFVEEILGCLNEAVKLAERCRERHDPKILGTVIGLVAKAERLVNKAAGRS